MGEMRHSGMRQWIGYVLAVAGVAVLLVGLAFVAAVRLGAGAFSHTYQSVIQDKYDALCATDSPKIILIGGSSVAYGFDEALLEEETGYSVVNLGLYGGLGDLFQTEIARANIQSGDIVVLAYEYNWIDDDAFTGIISDMVMSGIDGRIEMYRYIPLRNWGQILGYLPTYVEKKVEYTRNPGEDIHHTLFDAKGRLVESRPANVMGDYNEESETWNPVDLSRMVISQASSTYLRQFADDVENRGATIVMTAPPLLVDAAMSDPATFTELARCAEERTGIPYLGDPADYLFPAEYMYDTVYHCNETGARVRTQMFAQALNAFLEGNE